MHQAMHRRETIERSRDRALGKRDVVRNAMNGYESPKRRPQA